MDYDPIITITDVRRISCSSYARRWFESHDIDFKEFIQNGKRASELLALGDEALVQQVIDAKRSAENG